MLSFAIATGFEALLPRTRLVRFRFVVETGGAKWGCPSYWNAAAESVAAWLMPHEENASLERRDGSVEPAWSFRNHSNSSQRRKL
jgi:hypothetical protein